MAQGPPLIGVGGYRMADNGRTTKRKRATIYDVADRAGVSVFTVSRVINESGFVRAQTRQRVEEAVAELRYVPSANARNLRAGGSHAIGLLVPSPSAFWNQMVGGVQGCFSDYAIGLFLGYSRMDREEEQRQLHIALSQGVDGFLVAPVADDSPIVSELIDRDIPCVVLDRYVDHGVDVVRRDLCGAALQLTNLLLDQGHQRIALVNGPGNDAGTMERKRGYDTALRARAVALDEELVAWGPWSKRFGMLASEALLALDEPPTAIVAAGNMHAEGVLEIAGEAQMEVPGDLAIVSFGATPPLFSFLTAAASPASEMGKAAAEMLHERMQGYDSPPRVRLFHTKLHERFSAGPHRSAGGHR
jgi:LacI family transcriptional regulator